MADKERYYSKISLNRKTQEEAQRIQKLFEDNLNIANKIASKYYKTGYWDFDESLQIARMGLWKACLIWDPGKYRLTTLAYNIINRDFMDHDKLQKKQPDILFNLEDNCVTEDLSLSDVLVDESVEVDAQYQDNENVKELTQDIIYILDDISEDLHLSKSIVKIIYIVLIESQQYNDINLRELNFIPRGTVKKVIAEIQKRLAKIINY